jgi:hypothetical protein
MKGTKAMKSARQPALQARRGRFLTEGASFIGFTSFTVFVSKGF